VRGALKTAKGQKHRNRLPRGAREFFNENYPKFNLDKFDRTAVNRRLAELAKEKQKPADIEKEQQKPKLRKHFYERPDSPK